MKKNTIISLTMCAVMSITPFAAFAEDKEPMLISPAPAAEEVIVGVPQITVNNDTVDLSKSNLSHYIFEENNNVMVPLRAVAEKMGYSVGWDSENKAFTAENDDWKVTAYIDQDLYYGVTKIKDAVGMTAPQSYGTAPLLVDNTTFVPAKMFELIGYSYSSIGQFVNFTNTADENTVQIPNPFIAYENIDEAKKALSFNPSVPSYIPAGYSIKEISVTDDNFLQIIYENDSAKTICYRTAVGAEDISGDYNVYSNEKTIDISDLKISAKGNENIAVAVWNSGNLTYSIQADEELSEKEIIDIIQSL